DEGLFERARKMELVLEEAVHSLKGAPFVADIRNCGMAAGIDIEPDANAPGCRGYEAISRAFHDQDMVIRVGGDTIALAPALIATEDEITRMVDGVRAVLMHIT
ncbi:MAG: aspartate aminotransferase family protein, partial [Rhizomicrobium sp.]